MRSKAISSTTVGSTRCTGPCTSIVVALKCSVIVGDLDVGQARVGLADVHELAVAADGEREVGQHRAAACRCPTART